MKSFIRLGIVLVCIEVLHYAEGRGSASKPDDQNIDSILSFILTKAKPKSIEESTAEVRSNNAKQNSHAQTKDRESSHLPTNTEKSLKCTSPDCSGDAPVSLEAEDITRLDKPQRRHGTFLSNAMGFLDDPIPATASRQNVYRRNKNNATDPSPKKELPQVKSGPQKPGDQKRKFAAVGQRFNNAAKFVNTRKQPGTSQSRPNLGKIFPLLSSAGKQGPKGPAPVDHFQPNPIHLMMRPGKGHPKFSLMKTVHKPEKKQVGNLADLLGPHLGAGGIGPLQTGPELRPWDDFMGPGLTGGGPDIAGGHEMGTLPIHVNAPTVIHEKPLQHRLTNGINAGQFSEQFAPLPPLPFHHLPAPIPAFPLPAHVHHAASLPFPISVQSPARIEHVGYPIPVRVPGPPAIRPVVIPMKVPSLPRIQRVPFPVPVRMRPQIRHVPFPVPVVLPARPQIRHIPYPVAIPVKQPPQVEKYFYPVRLPQPLQVHHVPFPVYIHSPPRVENVPVVVPSPPEKVPVAVPGPTRYMVNKVPFPVIVPRIQNVPFPVPVDLHHHDDESLDG